MRWTLIFAVCFMATAGAVAAQSKSSDFPPMRKPLAIGNVTPNATKVGQYEKLELRVDLAASYGNPFDPDEVRLDAVFRAPSGAELTVPGFFMVRQKRTIEGGRETMAPEGEGFWAIRFAPAETGRYAWRLKLKDRSGATNLRSVPGGGEGSFEAVAGDNPGFLRQSKADPHYLAFDRGQRFFPISHNVPIYHTRGQLGDEAMRKLAAAGENYNRWWMSAGGFGIEWMDKLGWYRQDAAARIDLVLDQARELNLYFMMCMDTHQDFREQGWERNPFNVRNGGPCKSPAEWFTSPTARQFYKNRLRYTVARWGYSTNVLCWEFGNEFEGWDNSPNQIKLPWHKEMSEHLRSIDPFRHLITTSFWGNTGPEEFWDLPGIDIVQTHCYTNDDGNVAETVRRYNLHQWKRYNKPHVFGEFGIRSHSTTADKDPQGWAIHNGLWSGLFSFCAGGPMPWWHENYIDPLNLYFHFTALERFAKDVPLGTAKWEPLETGPPKFTDKARKPETRDAIVIAQNRWGKPEHNEFVLQSDGQVQGDRLPLQLLHGGGHPDLKNPPTFVVNYPQAGKFIVHVGTVSSSGLLRVWIDDRLALERALPCAEKLGKKSVYQAQWKLWETTYDEDLAVEVPAGRHRIRIDNFGKDWVGVTKYTFTGCKVLDRPNVLVCGMKSPRLAMLWIQNRESCWYNHGQGKVGEVGAFTLSVLGLANGRYRLEWWETWKGSPGRIEQAEVRDGRLTLDLPPLASDTALKIRPLP